VVNQAQAPNIIKTLLPTKKLYHDITLVANYQQSGSGVSQNLGHLRQGGHGAFKGRYFHKRSATVEFVGHQGQARAAVENSNQVKVDG